MLVYLSFSGDWLPRSLTHGLHETRDIGGGNGHSRGHLAVLPGVAVVRDDRRDSPRRGPAHGAHLA